MKLAGRRASAALLIVLLVGGGCEKHGHGIKGRELIALRSAEERRLVISNSTGGPLTLLPRQARHAPPPRVIGAGESFTVVFDAAEVVRAGQTVRSQRGYWTDGGQKFSMIEPRLETPYFEMSGPDIVVRVRPGGGGTTAPAEGEEWEFRIEVGDCVYDPMPAGGYRLEISGEPDPTTPMSLCRSRR